MIFEVLVWNCLLWLGSLVPCEDKIDVRDKVADKTGKHQLVLRFMETSVEKTEKSERHYYQFHSLTWEVKDGSSWTSKIAITSKDFQNNVKEMRWVSEIHSIDPLKGSAIIKIADKKPSDLAGSNQVIYSWREWDLLKNKEFRMIRVCKDPFEPFEKGSGVKRIPPN